MFTQSQVVVSDDRSPTPTAERVLDHQPLPHDLYYHLEDGVPVIDSEGHLEGAFR